jgi:hypothetical protein
MYLFQREDQSAAQRRDLTVQLYMRKYEDSVSPSYWQVSRAFDSGNELFKVMEGSQDQVARKAAADEVVNRAGLENISKMVTYFEEITSCAEKGQCDKELAIKLVQPDLTPFYCKAQLAGLPELRQQYNYPNYAVDLQKYAGACPPVRRVEPINPPSPSSS